MKSYYFKFFLTIPLSKTHIDLPLSKRKQIGAYAAQKMSKIMRRQTKLVSAVMLIMTLPVVQRLASRAECLLFPCLRHSNRHSSACFTSTSGCRLIKALYPSLCAQMIDTFRPYIFRYTFLTNSANEVWVYRKNSAVNIIFLSLIGQIAQK